MALVLLLFAFLFSTPALAGDTSSLNVIGYSPDGKVFGFEEYGIADGSGFAYSTIFLIDTAEDKFVEGTPIRVQVEDEGVPISKARATARAKADPLIARYKLADNPGLVVAYNPPSEIDSDPYKLRFLSSVSSPPYGSTQTLVLSEKDFPTPESCGSFSEVYKGFTLRLTEYQGQPLDKVVHDDTAVPASRLCANDYRIGAIISSEAQDVPLIAMILVGSYGFEGNDRRWIAVPVNPYGP